MQCFLSLWAHLFFNECMPSSIQVVSNLSCAVDHVLPILCSTKSVHSTEYGCFMVTLVTTAPKSDWEMAVLQIKDKHKVSSISVDLTVQTELCWLKCLYTALYFS